MFKRRLAHLPLVSVQRPGDSALACLSMVLCYFGRVTDFGVLQRRTGFNTCTDPKTMLVACAKKVGLGGEWQPIVVEKLASAKAPLILAIVPDRFVVLSRWRKRFVVVHDPLEGIQRLSVEDLRVLYTGSALELHRLPDFEECKASSRARLSDLVGSVRDLRRRALGAICLSLVLEALVLIGPYYSQIVVDRGISTGDKPLLLMLALAFGFVMGLHVIAEVIRTFVLVSLTQALHVKLVSRLFSHFIRLPMRWFEERHFGDIASRFGATNEIKELFTHGLMSTLVDGVMAALTLILMFFYSSIMALVAVTLFLVSAVVRHLTFSGLSAREEDRWQASAFQQTHFMETTRAIQSIKILAQEHKREALWRMRFNASIEKSSTLERYRAMLTLSDGVLGGLENVVSVYIGATLVIDGQITVGMLFAFMSYKMHFVGSAYRLLQALTKYRMLSLHLERVGDITLEPPEPVQQLDGDGQWRLEGAVELRQVSFHYPLSDRLVLSNVSFSVAAGEFVAITGPSGGGKTTLLKVMLGLLEPDTGDVRFDGMPASRIPRQSLRAELGVIMQKDSILAGTVLENITFFDDAPDREWARQCATTAGLEAEIAEMPLGFDSEVSDASNGLSGGQRQRLLLARALYRRPRILLLDEGTSHLDVAKEEEVMGAIARLGITRIMIAHRPNTIAAADRVYELTEGSLVETTHKFHQRPDPIRARLDLIAAQSPAKAVPTLETGEPSQIAAIRSQ